MEHLPLNNNPGQMLKWMNVWSFSKVTAHSKNICQVNLGITGSRSGQREQGGLHRRTYWCSSKEEPWQMVLDMTADSITCYDSFSSCALGWDLDHGGDGHTEQAWTSFWWAPCTEMTLWAPGGQDTWYCPPLVISSVSYCVFIVFMWHVFYAVLLQK